MKYAVVIERAGKNLSAFVPDLPGCVATGKSLTVIRRHIREAIEFHIEGLLQAGQTVPKATSSVEFVQTTLK
ncbi:MAG: type II toxin-antitoxin system HicB family antitoxin [Planctomycetes bacterium]|nr:type II toxin-antitoxin system HicB family antitoxin [Planctomycetota bacterium]